MAGITHRVSTSSFKPLSLNEIMMVPLAKRKMEDDFLANTEKISQLEASTLAPDSEEAQAILGGIKERAGALSDDILKRGFSRGQMNKLRGLRGDVTKEYGSEGFLGNAIANKKAAAEYAKGFDKKDNQGGWGSRLSQSWAAKNIQNFQGTRGEDGSFNSFSGQGLNERVDSKEWIDSSVAKVASDLYFDGKITSNKVNSYSDLIKVGKTDKKSFEKIMSSLKIMAQGDTSLIASLRQEAELYGKDPNLALDFGKMGVKKDSDGKERDVWIPGKSSFGIMMYGAAAGASFNKDQSKTYLQNNPVQIANIKRGADANTAALVSRIGAGFVQGVTAENFDDIVNNLSFSKETLKEMRSELPKIKETYGEDSKQYNDALQNINLQTAKNQNLENIFKGSTEHARGILGKSSSTAADLSNEINNIVNSVISENRLDDSEGGIYEDGSFKSSVSEKFKNLAQKELDLMEGSKSVEAIAKEIYPSWGEEGSNDSNPLANPQAMMAVYMHTKGVSIKDIKEGSVSSSTGTLKFGRGKERYRLPLQDWSKEQNEKMRDISSKELKQNAYSIRHEDLGFMEGSSGDKINQMLTDNFATANYYDPYTNEDIHSYLKREYYDAAKGDGKDNVNGIKVEIMVLPGAGPGGEPLEKMIIIDKKTNEPLEQRHVTRGGNYATPEHLAIAQSLMKSNSSESVRVGTQMYNDLRFMRSVRKAGLRSPATEGVFEDDFKMVTTNDDGSETVEKRPITWTQVNPDEDGWIINIDGVASSEVLTSEKQVTNYIAQIIDNMNKD